MGIGIGIWAFVVYIATIILWMLALKRNVTEGMGVGLIVVALFNGPAQTIQTIATSVNQAAQETPFLCTMLFLIMATIMTKAGIIARLVELFRKLTGCFIALSNVAFYSNGYELSRGTPLCNNGSGKNDELRRPVWVSQKRCCSKYCNYGQTTGKVYL